MLRIFLLFLVILISNSWAQPQERSQAIAKRFPSEMQREINLVKLVSPSQDDVELATTEHTEEMSICRKAINTLAKKLMKHVKGCKKELKEQYPDEEVYKKHSSCLIRCFMVKVKLVTDSFEMNNQTIHKFFEEQEIHPEHQEFIFQIATPCTTEHAPKLMGSDEFCQPFGAYFQCLQQHLASNAEQCKQQETS